MAEPILSRRRCFWWFKIRFTKYVVETGVSGDIELVIKTGLISKRIEKIKLFKINDITYHRTFGNFFFGVGNIDLATTDQSSGENVYITKIRKAKQFFKDLEALIAQERSRLGVVYNERSVI